MQYTPKGLLKKRIRKALRYALLAVAIVGTYRLRKDGVGFSDFLGLLRQSIRSGLLTVLDASTSVNRGVSQMIKKI